MPDIAPKAGGTQDAFLVRLRTDTGLEGWGESTVMARLSLASPAY